MGNIELNPPQASNFTPAVCFHNGLFHMVFAAANNTNELLHAISHNGNDWTRLRNLGQTTKQAPAIESDNGRLRCVFVANNDSNTLLLVTWDEANDIWVNLVNLGETSKTGPTLFAGRLFFIANNDSNDILIAAH
jgi:hypothetical protein